MKLEIYLRGRAAPIVVDVEEWSVSENGFSEITRLTWKTPDGAARKLITLGRLSDIEALVRVSGPEDESQ